MKWPHTHYPRGKRVRITLRDGTIIIDKFVERIGKFIYTQNHRVQTKYVKSMGYYVSH